MSFPGSHVTIIDTRYLTPGPCWSMRLQADVMIANLVLLVAHATRICAGGPVCAGLNFVIAGMAWDEINAIRAEYLAACG